MLRTGCHVWLKTNFFVSFLQSVLFRVGHDELRLMIALQAAKILGYCRAYENMLLLLLQVDPTLRLSPCQTYLLILLRHVNQVKVLCFDGQ